MVEAYPRAVTVGSPPAVLTLGLEIQVLRLLYHEGLPTVNFKGLVQLGSRRPIDLKIEYVNQRIELHAQSDLHRCSLCS
jgi:hypothetical protein